MCRSTIGISTTTVSAKDGTKANVSGSLSLDPFLLSRCFCLQMGSARLDFLYSSILKLSFHNVKFMFNKCRTALKLCGADSRSVSDKPLKTLVLWDLI